MRKVSRWLSLWSCVGVLGVGVGCASAGRQQTESRLAASGFKVIPVTTAEQVKQMATLPADKLSIVNRGGKAYFVYPDPKQNVLYVGRNAQYSAYQSLLLNESAMQQSLQADNADRNAEILNSEATIMSNDPWGCFGVWVMD